jgi:tetratricopeptide (TPR) repeat protein
MRRLLAGLLRRPWLCAGVLLLLVLGGALAPQAYAWYQLRAGRAALERYHNAEARRHLDACLRLWPSSETAHLLAARAARRAGEYDEARRHLNACPSTEDRDSAAFLEWALLQAVEGDLLGVEEFLQSRAARDPAAAPLVREALAEGNTRMCRLRAANEILDRWLEAEPDNPRALYLRGQLMRPIQPNKSVPDYRRVVELDPDNDDARWWLAVSLQESGQFGEALTHLEYLRARGWPAHDLRARLARSLDRVGRTDEARALLDTLLAERPDDAYALRVRGQVEYLAGDMPAAEKWLREAVRVRPADYQARHTLAQCLREQHKDDAAQEEQAVAEKVKARQDRLAEIRTREMSLRPDDPALHCLMGVLYASLGNLDVAENWLTSALYVDRDYGPAHAALADLYERQGRDPQQVAEQRRLARGAKAPDPDARPVTKP